jgi:hypothetical protein
MEGVNIERGFTALERGTQPGPAGPFFGENCPLDSFPGPQNPSEEIKKHRALQAPIRGAFGIRRMNRRTLLATRGICFDEEYLFCPDKSQISGGVYPVVAGEPRRQGYCR